MTNSALLEIGVEHLPARFVPGALDQMELLARKELQEHNVTFTSLRALGSFRKLALIIEGLPAKAADIEREVKGPPAKLLKDAAGNFTPQSAGFAQKNGIKPQQLKIVDTPAGPFIYAHVKIKGLPVQKILPEIFANIVKSIQFPKTMVWEDSGLRYGRPLRTLIGLYGDKIVNFEVAGVKSGRVTLPLSSFGSKGIKIQNAETYVDTLKNQPQPILIEPQERKDALVKAITKEGSLRNLTAVIDPELVDETVYMTEHPVVVPGEFEIRFLTLPKELIITVLKKQIKMFHLVNDKGAIEPYFIAVRDGVSVNQHAVRDGFKKVMSARLSDAVFFFEADIKKGLNHFKDKLASVQFIEGLGTMSDKTERTKQIAQILAKKLGAKEQTVSQIADYAYADLTSGVVYEFPELQGYMGSVYAAKEGLAQEVCTGLREFYFPLTSASELPSTLEGALVSIAAKVDTIAGNFMAGQIPTGSEDPFALRRQAMGVIRMVLEFNLPLSIDSLLLPLEQTSYAGKIGLQHKALTDFLVARLDNILELRGHDIKVRRAVIENTDRDLPALLAAADALQSIISEPLLDSLSASCKRARNIVVKAKLPEIAEPDSALFETEAETKLYQKVTSIKKEITAVLSANAVLSKADALKIFNLLLPLEAELGAFFDSVMVNVEDEKLKNNRLALLGRTSLLINCIADIYKMN